MADDSRETDSTSIDSAINELAERKNGKHRFLHQAARFKSFNIF